jgi:hypothetical protein
MVAPMTDLVDLLEAMPVDQRTGALKVLDAIRRPLTVREMETALRDRWVSKSQATAIANVLKRFEVIAIVERTQ